MSRVGHAVVQQTTLSREYGSAASTCQLSLVCSASRHRQSAYDLYGRTIGDHERPAVTVPRRLQTRWGRRRAVVRRPMMYLAEV
jgi:hypothetical protein